MLGMDGLFTFVLSNLFVCLTLGLSLLPSLLNVFRTATKTPHQASPSDYLLVFGLKLSNNTVSETYIHRLDRTRQLFIANSQAQILILGGTTPGNSVSEATKGREWLIDHGVPEGVIQTEDQSLNTLENLKNARKLLKSPSNSVCLITNRFHLYRVSRLASGMSLIHTLCAAEETWNLSISTLIRLWVEACYIHWYEVGRAWTIITKNKKSMNRISS